MERPISQRSTEEYTGTFQHLKVLPEDLRGVFAFTYYNHNPASNLRLNPYLLGINAYSDAILREGSVFAGWKIVIYTDQISRKILEDHITSDPSPSPGYFLLDNPNVVLILVKWPYYEAEEGVVNGDILRCMRLRAFFDFFSVPVFMRDADTIWAIDDYESGKKQMENITSNRVYEWEANYLRGALEHPNTFIFGTSLGYKRFWHQSKTTGLHAPLGAFAGLQSTIQTVPCFTSEELWEKALDYILLLSKRTGTIYSNAGNVGRIGKDEQILIYVFLPACFDSVFFFELDMTSARPFILQDHKMYENSYPSYIFHRGSNANLKILFQKGKNKEFKENLEKNRQIVLARNKELEKSKEQEIRALFKELGNAEDKINSRPPYFYFQTPTSASYALQALQEKMGSSNAQLAELFKEYDARVNSLRKKRLQFSNQAKYGDPDQDLSKELEMLRAETELKDKAMEAVIRRALELKPKEEIVASIEFSKQPEVQKTMNFFTGVPIVPFAPAPPMKAPLSFLQFLKKAGRRKLTQKKRHKQKRRRQTRRR